MRYVLAVVYREDQRVIEGGPLLLIARVNLAIVSAQRFCAADNRHRGPWWSCAGQKKKPLVCGKEVDALSPTKYRVVEALLSADRMVLDTKSWWV